jgi:hypothetical protein
MRKTASSQGIQGQEVPRECAGVDDFDGARWCGVPYPAVLVPVPTCHHYVLPCSVEGQTGDGSGASSVAGLASFKAHTEHPAPGQDARRVCAALLTGHVPRSLPQERPYALWHPHTLIP